MNPRKHIFVLIIFLIASLQVEAAYGVGGEAVGQNSGEKIFHIGWVVIQILAIMLLVN